jgi:Bacterial archaeo-eukaryotic release factor family 10
MPEDNRADQTRQTPQTPRIQQTDHQSSNSESHRKKHGKKWRELHPRSLLRAMGSQDGISEDKVRALVETEYTDPVISLYIALSPDKVAPEPRGLVRSFHSMKTRAFEKHKDFIESLSKSQRATLEHDLQEIQGFLADYFVPQHLRSLIIFRSGEKLNEVIGLLVLTSDVFKIDPDPYIAPLEAVLEDDEKVLFVESAKDDTKFLLYQLGSCQQIERAKSFVPTDTVDKTIPHRAQEHRLEHLRTHLRQVASEIYQLYDQGYCDLLVLMAENRVAALLEEYLHESLKPKIIARILDSPEADARDRKELIENALRAHRAEKETKAIQSLRNHKPEELVSTLRNVINAQNLFLVRKLFVSEGLRRKGFVCKDHHYLSLEPGACPFDNAKLLTAENVVDEIIEVARLHGVEVLIIKQRQDLLAQYAGIAAIQYVVPPQALAASGQ